MPRLVLNPRFWLAGFLIWFAVLWVMSSLTGRETFLPPSDQMDKVAHFGYFFGGSGLLCAYLYRRNPDHPNWKVIIGGAILALSLNACLDEYHQSFSPGRSGNDPADLLADVFGAAVGAFTFKRIHHRLK
ncbi:MAG: VanZ family protein [Verrucomicrobiota bacterium]